MWLPAGVSVKLSLWFHPSSTAVSLEQQFASSAAAPAVGGNYCSGGRTRYTLTVLRADPLPRVKHARVGTGGEGDRRRRPHHTPPPPTCGQQVFQGAPLTGQHVSQPPAAVLVPPPLSSVTTTGRSSVTSLYSAERPTEPQALQTHELFTYKSLNRLRQTRGRVCRVRAPTLQKWG